MQGDRMNPSISRSGLRTLTVPVLAVMAVFSVLGGIWLATVTGVYYVVVGALFLLVAVQLYKRATGPLWVYAALVLGSIVWSVWEVGFNFWALAPRLTFLALFGLWLLVPAITRGMGNLKWSKLCLAATLVLTLIVLSYSYIYQV